MQFGTAATLKSICCKDNVVSGLRQALMLRRCSVGYILCTGIYRYKYIYMNMVVDWSTIQHGVWHRCGMVAFTIAAVAHGKLAGLWLVWSS